MHILFWRYLLWDRNGDNLVLFQEIHVSFTTQPQTLETQVGLCLNSASNTPVFSLNLLEDTSANRKQLREEIWKVFGSIFEGPGSGHLNRLPKECLHAEKMKFSRF